MNNNILKYYNNTKNIEPHELVKKIIQKKEKGIAIDIGVGAGRDTVALLKNGWSVTAIDKNDTSNIIKENLNKDEIKRLTFICDDVTNIKFPKSDLIISFNVLSFVDKKSIKCVIEKIRNSLNKNGIVILNFFGKEDGFKDRISEEKERNEIYLYDESEIKELLKDFEIIKLNEIKKDEISGDGVMKHWHIYTVVVM